MRKTKVVVCLFLVLLMVMPTVLAACGPTTTLTGNPGEYTYRLSATSLPTNWNSHNYTSNDATTVTGYAEDSLYTFDYNEDETTYQIVPSMATEMPIDVSEQYAEKYGYGEETGRAYKIPLRTDLKFENGDPITAHTFVESIQLLLDPQAKNFRADSLWTGNLKILNADKYNKQGISGVQNIGDVFGTLTNAKKEGYGYDKLFLDLEQVDATFTEWFGADFKTIKEKSPTDYAKFKMYDGDVAGKNFFDKYDLLTAKDGKIKITEQMVTDYNKCKDWNPVADEELALLGSVDYTYPEMDFSEVGVFVENGSDYNLIIVLSSSLKGFYLNYSLSDSFWLVHPETYKACSKTVNGVFSTTYGTSKDTYVGFGPYKIQNYTKDALLTFEKNTNWWGYKDPEQKQYYQTTHISIQIITNEATRLEKFTKGELDSYSLTETDMAEYGNSKYLIKTEGYSTWYVAMNPGLDNLTKVEKNASPSAGVSEVDKQILTIKEFRQALSFSLDRDAWVNALEPMATPAKAMYNDLIIYDPDTATTYRSTDQAKDTLLNFWGLADEVGPGLEYETKDEAIASITGYDLAQAKVLFDTAYDKAKQAGYITSDNFEIQIIIGKPSDHEFYTKAFEYLKSIWTNAVKGTKLEGHLKFIQSQTLGSTTFAEYLRNGSIDMLFGVGWSGSALDPFYLMQAYVAPNYQYDSLIDTSKEMINITLDIDGKGEKTYRASSYAWGAEALGGTEDAQGNVGAKCYVVVDGEATNDYVYIDAGNGADIELRLNILAAVENAVLQRYTMIPLTNQATAELTSQRVKYYKEQYIYGVGYGGIKYMTYAKDDAQWVEYIKQSGGRLNYKG